MKRHKDGSEDGHGVAVKKSVLLRGKKRLIFNGSEDCHGVAVTKSLP